MRTLAVLLFAALAAPAQDARDDESIRALIRKLDDADFAVREEAWQALVKVGASAVARLKEAAESGASAEVKARAAEALRAIELAAKTDSVYREPSLVTVDLKDVPAATALAEIAKQAGVKLDGLAHAPEATVTLKLERAPLYEALDRLCASLPTLTWAETAANVVALSKEAHVRVPSAYAGPFRVRASEVMVMRKTNFRETTVTGSVELTADWQHYLKPLSRVRYEVTSATDETGAALKAVAMSRPDGMVAGAGAAGVVVLGLGMGMDDKLDRTFQISGLAPRAATIASLKGTATFSFPLEHRPVKFSAPGVNDREDAGDFAFKITNTRGRMIEFDIEHAKAGADASSNDEIDRRLDADSFVLVDADGKEHRAESVGPSDMNGMMFAVVAGGGPGAVERKFRYKATFPARVASAKELRFRFIDKTFEKKVEFELKDVKAE